MFTKSPPLSALSARRQAILRGPTLDTDLLAGVHPGIQTLLWSWLVRAIDESLWELAGLVPPLRPRWSRPCSTPRRPLLLARSLAPRWRGCAN